MNRKVARVFFIAVLALFSAAACSRQPQQEQAFRVVQAVEGIRSGEELVVSSGQAKTAMDLLKGSYQVETREFAGVGEYVEAIGGIRAESGKTFWAFYVNGKLSPVGASQYRPMEGDRIEWKLEKNNPNL